MTDTFSILVVCTGNICRSPYGERILRHYAEEADLDLMVESAGTHAEVGNPMHPETREVLEARGISSRNFVAEQVTRQMVEKYDLVLGLTRTHQRFMALSAEDSRHVVTWKTWERLLGIYGFDGSDQPHPSFTIPGVDFSTLTLHEAHRAVMKHSVSEVSSIVEKYSYAVDVSDPWGYDLGVFEEMAEDMDAAAHLTIQYVLTLKLLIGGAS